MSLNGEIETSLPIVALTIHFLFDSIPWPIILADQVEERFSRRSMVRLGVRVIHKISSETKAQPIVATNPNTLSKSLRLRLSPKALKISNKSTTNTDENSHPRINYGSDGSSVGCDSSNTVISRMDMEKQSLSNDNRKSRFSKVGFLYVYSNIETACIASLNINI